MLFLKLFHRLLHRYIRLRLFGCFFLRAAFRRQIQFRQHTVKFGHKCVFFLLCFRRLRRSFVIRGHMLRLFCFLCCCRSSLGFRQKLCHQIIGIHIGHGIRLIICLLRCRLLQRIALHLRHIRIQRLQHLIQIHIRQSIFRLRHIFRICRLLRSFAVRQSLGLSQQILHRHRIREQFTLFPVGFILRQIFQYFFVGFFELFLLADQFPDRLGKIIF